MEFKLTDGRTEVAVFEATTAEAMAEALAALGIEAGASLQLHLWHDEAWWNLTSDLAQFTEWLVETGRMSAENVSRFMRQPWVQPHLLWEAARQLQRLLDAVSGAQQRSGAPDSSTK